MPGSSTLYVLGDIMSQYSIDLLRAFNSDGDISDSRWKSGIEGIRSWNREVIDEEVKALRSIDTQIDKVILQAMKRYAPRATEAKVSSFLRHFMKALAQTTEVLDRSILDDLSFDDRANIFRRLTRRAIYLCCQSRVGPDDSISQVMFKNRKGALMSWRNTSGSKSSLSTMSTKPAAPLSPRKRRRSKKRTLEALPEPADEEEEEDSDEVTPAPAHDDYEVSRCFDKLDHFRAVK